MRNIPLVTEEIYHVCNRAVEGRNIFSSLRDCRYFTETCLLVNTTDTRHLNWRRTAFRVSEKQRFDLGNPLVEIYAFTLMPNHFHMLLRQKIDDGISLFLLRLCNSYSKFYNQKHKRKGALFMGRFKAVHISSDPQAAHIFSYIHGNPLDLVEPGWREGIIKNWDRARQFLKNYQWSSLGIYSNNSVDSFIRKIVNTTFAENYFSKTQKHFESLKEWSMRFDEGVYLD